MAIEENGPHRHVEPEQKQNFVREKNLGLTYAKIISADIALIILVCVLFIQDLHRNLGRCKDCEIVRCQPLE
jgi:hypothetical protein